MLAHSADYVKTRTKLFANYITDCPGLRQFRTDNIGHFNSNTWKTTELLNFSYIPEINDYLESKRLHSFREPSVPGPQLLAR